MCCMFTAHRYRGASRRSALDESLRNRLIIAGPLTPFLLARPSVIKYAEAETSTSSRAAEGRFDGCRETGHLHDDQRRHPFSLAVIGKPKTQTADLLSAHSSEPRHHPGEVLRPDRCLAKGTAEVTSNIQPAETSSPRSRFHWRTRSHSRGSCCSRKGEANRR